MLAAELHGALVGQVGLYNIDMEKRSAEYGRLLVAAPGAGLGRLVTWGALLMAQSQLGLTELHLCVKGDNHAAVRLYLESGFRWDPELALGRLGLAGTEPLFWMSRRWPERSWQRWDAGDATSAVRRAWNNDVELAWRDMLAGAVFAHVPRNANLLEVGCGAGLVHDALRRGGLTGHYLGYDTSYAMLGEAMRVGRERSRFAVGDIYALPSAVRSADVRMADRAVDYVICFEVLRHLPRIEEPIAELCRVTQRKLLFTLTVGEEMEGAEGYGGQTFLSHTRTVEHVREALRVAAPDMSVRHEMLRVDTALFVAERA
jgi:SAM-dependent methyltransferase